VTDLSEDILCVGTVHVMRVASLQKDNGGTSDTSQLSQPSEQACPIVREHGHGHLKGVLPFVINWSETQKNGTKT
jgi:hypothetical protein